MRPYSHLYEQSERTTTSAFTPNASHRSPGSNVAHNKSVCARKRGGPALSNAVGGARHLAIRDVRNDGESMNVVDLLRTPSLYHTGKVHLFGIVRNERSEFEDSTAVVPIWAAYDMRRGHSWAERCKDMCEGSVIQLLLENTEFITICVLFGGLKHCSQQRV